MESVPSWFSLLNCSSKEANLLKNRRGTPSTNDHGLRGRDHRTAAGPAGRGQGRPQSARTDSLRAAAGDGPRPARRTPSRVDARHDRPGARGLLEAGGSDAGPVARPHPLLRRGGHGDAADRRGPRPAALGPQARGRRPARGPRRRGPGRGAASRGDPGPRPGAVPPRRPQRAHGEDGRAALLRRAVGRGDRRSTWARPPDGEPGLARGPRSPLPRAVRGAGDMTSLPDPDRWPVIAPILAEALDLPPEQRAPFLDRACAGDSALRREIEELLRADERAGDFLGAPVDLTGVAVPDDDGAGGDPPSASGSTIGPYRVVREIGRGGMGVVYEAEQKSPRRPVALKVILGGRHVDAEAVRMFRRETDSLARLKHPSIAAIYESGSTEEGQHYFAMELVQGISLSEFLDEKGTARSQADVRLRLVLFRKICAAVAYAHQRGVIHLDLKPSNILVLESPGGEVPEIKVLDFGLARITDPDAQGATAVTAFGRVQGTLPYMSPEQVRGRRDEVDVRSDVYALGVILYRMLTGRLPYDLDGLEITEAARIVCEETPRPLRSAEGGEARFDHDLTVIALKALEKEPARRYSGVAALEEEVARYLDGRPILARPPSAVYQIRKLVGRHKIPFAAAAALLVLLV